jgi:hypothetical protein
MQKHDWQNKFYYLKTKLKTYEYINDSWAQEETNIFQMFFLLHSRLFMDYTFMFPVFKRVKPKIILLTKGNEYDTE